MGPILSMTFGLATNKYEIVRRGLRNEMYGIVISLIVGLTMGLCASQLYSPNYVSEEMESRGKGFYFNLKLHITIVFIFIIFFFISFKLNSWIFCCCTFWCWNNSCDIKRWF